MNRDITQLFWMIIGIMLVISGGKHVITQQIMGRVHIAGTPPVMQGWSVVALGMLEAAIGIWMIVRYWRRKD
jgi:hypothetical protein